MNAEGRWMERGIRKNKMYGKTQYIREKNTSKRLRERSDENTMDKCKIAGGAV